MLDPKKNSTLVLYTIIKSEEFYGPSCSKGSRVPGSSVLIRNQAGHTHFDGSVILCNLFLARLGQVLSPFCIRGNAVVIRIRG